MTHLNLAQWVRQRREELGLTQDEVAKFGGPSTATVRTIENGQAENFHRRTFAGLDQALQWQPGTASKLFNGEWDQPRTAGQVSTSHRVETQDGPDSMDVLADEIRQARIALGWTKSKAAVEAGLARKTYIRIEAGEPTRHLSLEAVKSALGLNGSAPFKGENLHISSDLEGLVRAARQHTADMARAKASEFRLRALGDRQSDFCMDFADAFYRVADELDGAE